MHGKSRVSQYLFAIINNISFSTVQALAVAQWVRRWSGCHRVVQAEGSATYTKYFSAMIFISVLLGLMDFSDIVTLCYRPNSCYQQTLNWLKCSDMPLLSLSLFS